MMVLALISTACISNIICSLQAMLIYARISNAMEAKFWIFTLTPLAAYIDQSLNSRMPVELTLTSDSIAASATVS